MALLQRIEKFLLSNWDQKSPLLLGYSGGPDSKALLYLLLELGVRPHLAHVDHGWREESALQAKELCLEAESLGLPFHAIRVKPDRRESKAREQRLLFFASLWEKFPFQALLLAHHGDDWAETTLKRILEGAHLTRLSGMREISHLKGMTLWRPLLSSCQEEILAYLSKRGLKGIADSTNLNSAYLRARMRATIIPSLSQTFGKEVHSNLPILAARSCELSEYLDRKTDEAFRLLKKGPWGWVWPPLLTEAIEIRHLLQRLDLPFSRDSLEGLVRALAERRAHYRCGQRFIADRGYFFYLAKELPPFMEPIDLQEGSFTSGKWKIDVQETPFVPSSGGWLDLFCGSISFTVPKGEYRLQMAHANFPFLRKRLHQQSVPAFLRPYIPYIHPKTTDSALDLFRLPPASEGLSVQISIDSTIFD